MHQLAALPGAIADGSPPVHLDQTPGDIVVLSAADMELAALAQARATLDVPRHASEDEIRLAHRRIATINHPDKGGSAATLQEANAARDLLLDHISRTPTEPPQ